MRKYILIAENYNSGLPGNLTVHRPEETKVKDSISVAGSVQGRLLSGNTETVVCTSFGELHN